MNDKSYCHTGERRYPGLFLAQPIKNWIPTFVGMTCICLLLFPLPSFAETLLPDPAQETHAKALFHEFRCMVCQSESLADSNADLAVDMRGLIRERLRDGDSDTQIRDYLVARYGDYILMNPPLKISTWLLWFTPLLVLLAGTGMVFRLFRKERV